MDYKLLFVDDEMANIRLLERLFRHEYNCLTASSAEEALELLDQHEVAVIITDQRMPSMTGVELLKRSADRRPHMVRILLTGYTDLEALVEAVNCGLVYMYVSKPWNNDDLKLRVSRAVQHYEANKRQHLLAANNDRLNARLHELKLGFVRATATMLEMQDEALHAHSSRVSKYVALLGEKLNLTPEQMVDVDAAAFINDIRVLAGVAEFKHAEDIVRYQNENYDGSGMPLGLIGDQIPLAARVLRAAKEFDLLTSANDGSPSISHAEAFARLQHGSGHEFDPRVVTTFNDLVREDTPSLIYG
jgi:response regulator RpfG family c-di-GMP phosphodiesterase